MSKADAKAAIRTMHNANRFANYFILEIPGDMRALPATLSGVSEYAVPLHLDQINFEGFDPDDFRSKSRGI